MIVYSQDKLPILLVVLERWGRSDNHFYCSAWFRAIEEFDKYVVELKQWFQTFCQEEWFYPFFLKGV